MNAVTTSSRTQRRVPLIDQPLDLATYMIEGGGSKEYRYAKGLMYSDPDALHVLLEKLATAVTDFERADRCWCTSGTDF